MPSVVTVATQDHIRTITVNRPDKLNALNRETLEALDAAFADAAGAADVRVVVLTGAGPKAFVAGADIAQMRGLTPDAPHRDAAQTGHRDGQRLCTRRRT